MSILLRLLIRSVLKLPVVHPFMWGLWLVAIPVLIHLINMFRHQPVHWAAMEFLLASQKKYRTWVVLKQLLLLLLRMLAIALVVLALAQPLLPDRWGSFFSPHSTHHIVLLDDSYSMSDRLGESSAFDQAKEAILRLGQSMLRPREPQSFTLLRFSRCGGAPGTPGRGAGVSPASAAGTAVPQSGGALARQDAASTFDFQKEQVDSEFSTRLANTLKSIEVSQTAAEPLPACEAVRQLLGADTGERRVIYLFSDYRARQWDKPDDLKKQLVDFDKNHVEIRLVDCVEDAGHPNLAITALEPEEGIRAAGVQWRMKVSVRNFGPATVRKVPVFWSADNKSAPQLSIDEIPPGGTVDKLFYVSFPTAGQHRIAANLDADAVEADNSRYCAVDLPLEVPVLLIDGTMNHKNSRRLQDVMAPGGLSSGIDARRIETPRYLSLPTRPLNDFAMICVSNVDRIEPTGVEALEQYVKGGGGLFFVAGPQTSGDFVTRSLYRDGKGLFPLPLAGPKSLAVSNLDNTPDVQSEEHPVFHGIPDRVGYVSKIFIKQYFALPAGWDLKHDPDVRVIMRLRDGAPLLVEKQFGRGRVVALLTTVSSQWNNWSVGEGPGPSFVAFVRNLVPYLSRRSEADDSLLVGEPKTVTFASPKYAPTVNFTVPGSNKLGQAKGVPGDTDKDLLKATFPETAVSGFYTYHLTASRRADDAHRDFAVNVDPAEGDLKALAGPDVIARLAPELKCPFEYASRFETKLDETRGRNLGDFLLLVLVIVLVLEQLLAWSCGYHLAGSRRGTREAGRGAANHV